MMTMMTLTKTMIMSGIGGSYPSEEAEFVSFIHMDWFERR